jgi:hypothetical protein
VLEERRQPIAGGSEASKQADQSKRRCDSLAEKARRVDLDEQLQQVSRETARPVMRLPILLIRQRKHSVIGAGKTLAARAKPKQRCSSK